MTALDFITGDRGQRRITMNQMIEDDHLAQKLDLLDLYMAEWFPHLNIDVRHEYPSGDVLLRWEPKCDICAGRDLSTLLLTDGKLTLCTDHLRQMQDQEGFNQ